jgi:NitT/TauT family transport system substrate-binding protein
MSKTRTLLATAIAGAVSMFVGEAVAQQPDKPLTHVSMRFGYVATGNDTFWAYGKEKGFFRDEGIDIEFREGKGSATTAQSMAAGSDDFAVDIDGGAFLGLAGKGLPATAVMAPVAKSPIVLLSPADKPLVKPSELVGKQIAIAGGSGAAALLPVFLKANNIDADKVTLVNMQSSPLLTTLLTGRVDAVATNIVVQATLRAKGLETTAMRYADFGLTMPGQYLITSNVYLAEKPDIVARMVRALQKSMQATIDDPKAAAEAFHRAFPAYDMETALAESKIIIDYFRSPDTQGKPLGAVSVADATAGFIALKQAGIVTTDVDISKVVTNQFVH